MSDHPLFDALVLAFRKHHDTDIEHIMTRPSWTQEEAEARLRPLRRETVTQG